MAQGYGWRWLWKRLSKIHTTRLMKQDSVVVNILACYAGDLISIPRREGQVFAEQGLKIVWYCRIRRIHSLILTLDFPSNFLVSIICNLAFGTLRIQVEGGEKRRWKAFQVS